MARPERIRLGDLLIQEALITPAQLDEALVEQKKTGRLIRPSSRYVGPGPRPLEDVAGYRP